MSRPVCYSLYQRAISSTLPLNAPRLSRRTPDIVIVPAPRGMMEEAIPEPPENRFGIHFQALRKYTCYIRFYGILRFLISKDGRTVYYQIIGPKPRKISYAALAFLQTNVLSFSLLRLGTEVFHASAVEFKNYAAAFLGESGYGKSTLAAGLLEEGARLITDDVLGVRKKNSGYVVSPGVAHLKLLPETSRRVFPEKKRPKSSWGPKTRKQVFSLPSDKFAGGSLPLGVLYILWPRFRRTSRQIWARKLNPREAMIALVKCSHNLILQDSARLKQQMKFVSQLIRRVPVRALSYPMHFSSFPRLKALVQSDMTRQIRKLDFASSGQLKKQRQKT